MDNIIREQFHEGILKQAIAFYDVALEDVKYIGGFESNVYTFIKSGTAYILKITHTFRRSVDYLMGEIYWLSFLEKSGLAVSAAVQSMQGRYVETIPVQDSTDEFLVMAYLMAPGNEITEVDWKSSTFYQWGQLMGKMHALTKQYTLANPAYQRRTHMEDVQILVDGMGDMPRRIRDISAELIQRLSQLPKTEDVYGLVHSDLHHGNLFIQGKTLTAIDFDDCSYTWFANDIAIALYYALWIPKREITDKSQFIKEYLTSFLEGYEQELVFERSWLQYFHDFFRLRHLTLYIVLHRSWDLTNLSERQKSLLKQYSDDLFENRRVVDFDFSTL